MKNIKLFIGLILSMIVWTNAFGQVRVEATLENQMVVGTDFFFDVYLRTSMGTSGDLYLDNADFVFTFNHSNFTNPALSKVPNPSPPLGFIQNGYCTFISVTNTDATATATNNNVQKVYYDNTATSISASGELVINLNGPAPSDLTNFNDKVAKINGVSSTHRLGRFKVSGITNAAGTMNLKWKPGTVGLRTKIFSLADSSPFTSTQVLNGNLTLIDPTDALLPIQMSDFEVYPKEEVIVITWTTATEIHTDDFYILKSTNGHDWMELTKLDAAGYSNSPIIYQYPDREPIDGNNYYRIKTSDMDGSFTLSEIKVAKYGRIKPMADFEIYPNPAHDEVRLIIDKNLTAESVAIFDLKGVMLFLMPGNQSIDKELSLQVSELPAGMYFIQIITPDEILSKKFVKN